MSLEPTRISLARLRAGMTKSELARTLGVTPRTITTYETDGAPTAQSARLAESLGVTPGYFTRPEAMPLEEDRVLFRARRRTSARTRGAAIAAGRTGVEFYALIREHFHLPSSQLPDLSSVDPAAAALQLRLHWDLGTDPVPNLVQLAESRGIRVLGLPGATQQVDAFSIWEDGEPFVFLAGRKTAERMRFDLAHEIGHLVLHSGHQGSRTDGTGEEKEADAFAAELLMPPDLVKPLLGREPAVDKLLRIRRALGVSAMALTYRAHRWGLLTDWSYRRACIELTKRGFRTGEPGGITRESSRVMRTVLPALQQRHRLSTEAIARRLGVPPGEIHELSMGQALLGLRTAPEPTGHLGSEPPTRDARPLLHAVR
ncbi:XRE family transcriptional regulator [Amycolatopsis sp. H6(2020)]|nr:XRE family transcriptional regulator [Amycolatopsis sp. H6(2020)]